MPESNGRELRLKLRNWVCLDIQNIFLVVGDCGEFFTHRTPIRMPVISACVNLRLVAKHQQSSVTSKPLTWERTLSVSVLAINLNVFLFTGYRLALLTHCGKLNSMSDATLEGECLARIELAKRLGVAKRIYSAVTGFTGMMELPN